jgi:hypothetical protein
VERQTRTTLIVDLSIKRSVSSLFRRWRCQN